MNNLGQFLRTYSLQHNARIAYEIKRGFRTEKFSFADVHSLALKTATLLKSYGLKKGDTVVIWAPNMPEYPILYFACWILGIIVVPIDIRTTEETRQLFIATAGCKFGFKSKIIAGSFPPPVAHTCYLEDLIELVQPLPELEEAPEVAPDDLAEIAFTSGTTGTPKGVQLTHRNFLANVSALCQTFPFKQKYRTLSLLPLSHAFEQVVDLLAVFQFGSAVTYLERINPATIISTLRKHRITTAFVVPQFLQLLMTGIEREIEKSGAQRIWSMLQSIASLLPIRLRRCIFYPFRQRLGKHFQFFGCGSAPLNSKLAQKWENTGIVIYEGYGATETTAVLTINTPFAKRQGSVGKALPGTHIQINPTTHEIIARGPNVSAGYFQDMPKTQQAFTEGWYRTGDIGSFDAEGYLYITGREALRIVLPGGEKVYPEDIENQLNAHPLVLESCVVGVQREQGERVHAAIITRYPQELDEIVRQVNQKLSSHEQILEWSLWRHDDFPRTPILKIDRRKVANAIEGRKETLAAVQISEDDKLRSLIAQSKKIPVSRIKETDVLTTDLALDSLQRVELLSLIEQDLGVTVAETEITEHTTVSQLRELIENAEVVPEGPPFHALNYTPLLVRTRVLLQTMLIFPLHSLFVPLEISGKENLVNLELPAIFYFNHMGIMDAVCVLRALPLSIRRKLVIAATQDLWQEWRQFFVEFWGGGFPFDTRHNIKASFELMGEFLDNGFSILIAPEGGISKDGTLQPFKSGIGFIATHMHAPVVPIKIDPSYREIFPPMDAALLENIPKKRKRIWVKIGEPMIFSKQSSLELAMQKIRQAMIEL
ncbi:AMP-binding protein [Dictyobacter formicarum]|uniref:AMP-binding protein n=1 Tax=Dictyobacter formicarum TaxID=2778368 RepID=A0ABQ3VS03_9CHLR|nr:AMP-binding protein [Dictyobacter formicarum]GHO89054.1 AMP-binding protein [Dictyobacter formicarum]